MHAGRTPDRYHLAGDVPWHHLPLFILNKATSLAAAILVASSYLIGKVIHWHDHDKEKPTITRAAHGCATPE